MTASEHAKQKAKRAAKFNPSTPGKVRRNRKNRWKGKR